ncbi:MAG: hypothetical protein OXB84_08340, partial [Halobacteriovoraceae bacterium]|nr:hypothetical protein [Halobacteriovoraceae bacterium]
VFISYKTNNLDYWIQMASRGGRRGEAFQVYSLDRFFTPLSQRILSIPQILLRDFLATFD